ncbi:MAG: hypothetical protein L0Y60_03015 [Beijerinckiaceae bacterium]|nr:hypothetical protein [Beijerinckiaceae bacterium]
MRGIIMDRIKINKILAYTISLRLDTSRVTLQELTKLCVAGLEIYYDGACPEECLEARARDFAAWHLARLGCVDDLVGGNRARLLERVQQKREPVLRPDTRQNKDLEQDDVRRKAILL